jgi:hypothetical protein
VSFTRTRIFIADRIPLLTPGSTGRNVLVGSVYLLVGGIAAMVVLVVLAAVLGTLVLGMGADAGGAATPADAAAGGGSRSGW